MDAFHSISHLNKPKKASEDRTNCTCSMKWTPLRGVDMDCLITDWVGCDTTVDSFILDLQREGEVSGDVWVADVVHFLLSSVPGQGEFICILHRTVNVAVPIIQ